jgi:hypothetical protein
VRVSQSYFRTLLSLVLVTSATQAVAEGFFVNFPMGIESFKSSHINGIIANEGLDSVTDLSPSTSSAGLGYEFASGFSLSIKGGQTNPYTNTESNKFLSLDLIRGGLCAELNFLADGMHRVNGGLTFGGKVWRWTVIGSNYQGVTQHLAAFVEPSVSYQYGGNSVRLYLEGTFAATVGDEIKIFGTPGSSALDSNSASLGIGLKVFL